MKLLSQEALKQIYGGENLTVDIMFNVPTAVIPAFSSLLGQYLINQLDLNALSQALETNASTFSLIRVLDVNIQFD